MATVHVDLELSVDEHARLVREAERARRPLGDHICRVLATRISADQLLEDVAAVVDERADQLAADLRAVVVTLAGAAAIIMEVDADERERLIRGALATFDKMRKLEVRE